MQITTGTAVVPSWSPLLGENLFDVPELLEGIMFYEGVKGVIWLLARILSLCRQYLARVAAAPEKQYLYESFSILHIS